jgi:hypothetical protein
MDTFAKMMVKTSNRSWWQVEYGNGKILSEWDTLTSLIHGNTSRWEEINKDNIKKIRLLCPDGTGGQLENTGNGKVFQLKSGGFIVGHGQYCNAHIIGVVTDALGNCSCLSWEMEKTSTSHKLVNCRDAEGLRVENKKTPGKYFKIDIHDAGMKNGNCWIDIVTLVHPRRLVAFRDNVLNMQYENLGNLNLDVQRLSI